MDVTDFDGFWSNASKWNGAGGEVEMVEKGRAGMSRSREESTCEVEPRAMTFRFGSEVPPNPVFRLGEYVARNLERAGEAERLNVPLPWP